MEQAIFVKKEGLESKCFRNMKKKSFTTKKKSVKTESDDDYVSFFLFFINEKDKLDILVKPHFFSVWQTSESHMVLFFFFLLR